MQILLLPHRDRETISEIPSTEIYQPQKLKIQGMKKITIVESN